MHKSGVAQSSGASVLAMLWTRASWPLCVSCHSSADSSPTTLAPTSGPLSSRHCSRPFARSLVRRSVSSGRPEAVYPLPVICASSASVPSRRRRRRSMSGRYAERPQLRPRYRTDDPSEMDYDRPRRREDDYYDAPPRPLKPSRSAAGGGYDERERSGARRPPMQSSGSSGRPPMQRTGSSTAQRLWEEVRRLSAATALTPSGPRQL